MTDPGAGSPGTEGLHDNPDLWLPRLGRILDEQLGLYRRLDELSQSQAGVIESGDSDALLTVLGQRQTIVERITALNADLEPFTSRWDTLSLRVPGTKKQSIRARLDELETLVGSITQRDEHDRAALEKQRAAVSSDLVGLGHQKSAHNAYVGSPRQGHVPRYQDRQG